MINELISKGYKRVSLSVNKVNFAIRLYKKLGFEIIKANEKDFMMVLKQTKSHSILILSTYTFLFKNSVADSLNFSADSVV